jgi:hypothetical protein
MSFHIKKFSFNNGTTTSLSLFSFAAFSLSLTRFFFPSQKAFSLNDVEIFCHAQAVKEKSDRPKQT